MKYPIKSKYRISGLLVAILPNLIWGFLTWTLFSATNFRDEETLNDSGLLFFLSVVGGIQLLFLLLLITQCPSIIITEETIKFVNPLLPFISKKFFWSDFDYCKSVEEYSKYATHRAVWLIKDGRIKKRVSSFYYKNYGAIIRNIKTPHKGNLKMGPIKQAFCMLGGRI